MHKTLDHNKKKDEDSRLVVKYNVVDASQPTLLYGYYAEEGQEEYGTFGVNLFDKVEIDGNEVSVADLDSARGTYQLSAGEHTVAYTLKDPTIIGNDAFANCTSLTSIDIPNSVTSIGHNSFFYCSGLTNITIPSSVISIGQNAFYDTPWWNTYSVDTASQYGNIIYINDVAYKAFSTSITSCEFKNGTVSISDGAFRSCSGLTSVTIGDGVKSIGGGAFSNCRSLTSVTIGDGVKSIGGGAFSNCRSLTSVTIGDGVKSIGGGAFEGCSGLTSVTIPSSVTTIGTFAFCGCPLDAISKTAIKAINPKATICDEEPQL